MAEARTVLTTKRIWTGQKTVHVVGDLAVTAGPDTYTTGGIAFDPLTNVVDGAGLGIAMTGASNQPFWVNVVGNTHLGQYNPTTKKIKFSTIVGGAEVAAGAVPAALSNDVIKAYFIYDKV